jgi:hypothetical protein
MKQRLIDFAIDWCIHAIYATELFALVRCVMR